MFNYFTARIEAITNDMEVSIQELIDWCEKQLLLKKPLQTEDPTEETATQTVEA